MEFSAFVQYVYAQRVKTINGGASSGALAVHYWTRVFTGEHQESGFLPERM